MSSDGGRVSELGEDALIGRIAARIGGAPAGETWAGDDCATFRLAGATLLFTTDMVVQGVDFDPAWSSPWDVGWKALAANASDVAAMGGRPRYAVAALSMPPDTTVATVDGIVDGLAAAARRWGISVVGGDISRAHETVVSVAMLGLAGHGGAPVLRSTARVGDAICVTGALGGAAGGLVALRNGLLASDRDLARERLAERQLRPQARLEEGAALARIGVTSMMDLSDGLAVDLSRMMEASATGCDIDPARIPIDADLRSLSDWDPDFDALGAALTGGEDFELLFTIEPSSVERARAELGSMGTAVTRIGVVSEGPRRIGGVDLETCKEGAWDHLLAR
ncbi:thiamine-phosphate kinase [soil metagenome]